jgi:hypothetical protein
MLSFELKKAALAAIAIFSAVGAVGATGSPVAQAAASGGVSLPVCSWELGGNSDVFNYGAPDTDAHYWYGALANTPGTEEEITGTYPAARYFSLTMYDSTQSPIGTLYDQKIVPDPGSYNPYTGPGKPGQAKRFTVHILFTAAPKVKAPNTLYAGSLTGPTTAGPDVVLREYLPNGGVSATKAGGVALPQQVVESSSGKALATEAACSAEPPDALADPWAIYASLSATPGQPTPAADGTTAVPAWGQAFGSAGANPQNAYLVTNVDHHWGQLVVFHFKAPSFPNTAAGQPVYRHHQLRYWSLCVYDSSGTVGWACIPDEDVPQRHGWVTFVVSDVAHRPANATAADGVAWLPWGPVNQIQLVERNMLPSANFAGAAQRLENPADNLRAPKIMGDYYPTTAYCSEQTFARGGWQACLPALAKRLSASSRTRRAATTN